MCPVPPDTLAGSSQVIDGRFVNNTTTYTCTTNYYINEALDSIIVIVCHDNHTWTDITDYSCKSKPKHLIHFVWI